jgi:2-keto-4-pentenoate hydratase/2-oxohepta-3-ene-1,7-dioic acid hydratase in catechol pathway
MTLEEGDFLITGTPAGVGPMVVGQKVAAELWDSEKKTLLSEIHADIVKRN